MRWNSASVLSNRRSSALGVRASAGQLSKAGIERYFRYRTLRRGELPSRAFQQQTPAHGAGAFFDQRLEEAKEAGAAFEGVPRQSGHAALVIQRGENDGGEVSRFRVVIGA